MCKPIERQKSRQFFFYLHWYLIRDILCEKCISNWAHEIQVTDTHTQTHTHEAFVCSYSISLALISVHRVDWAGCECNEFSSNDGEFRTLPYIANKSHILNKFNVEMSHATQRRPNKTRIVSIVLNKFSSIPCRLIDSVFFSSNSSFHQCHCLSQCER